MPACCEPWPGKRKAVFLIGLDDLAAVVVAAVRAHVVRPVGLSAVRARLELDEPGREVRAPTTLAALRKLDLGECHELAEVYQG
jgi:hypothetical protein